MNFEKILPRIKDNGYNAIQIMAIQEHPYYGSFGYHVSNFFAPSSRFGTPDELKHLIDAAHQMGLAVIMDIVHSHAVKTKPKALPASMDLMTFIFIPIHRAGTIRRGILFVSITGKRSLHFLLSNCKYWIEEFKFDGFSLRRGYFHDLPQSRIGRSIHILCRLL